MTIQRSNSSSLADQKSLIVCCDQMLVVCISRILSYYDSTFAAQRYPEDQQPQRSIQQKSNKIQLTELNLIMISFSMILIIMDLDCIN